MIELSGERRRRLTHRALPALGGLALVAGAAGMVVGSQAQSGSRAHRAASSPQAWERGDYGAMYDMLDDASREVHIARASSRPPTAARPPPPRPPASRWATRRASATASVTVPVEVQHARVRAACAANLRLPVDDEQVTWGPLLAFPGLRRGEALARESEPPERATLLSRDGKVLARGPGRRPQLAARGDRRLDRRHARARGDRGPSAGRSTRAASRATGRSGRTGSSTPSRTAWPGGPGGRLLAGDRVIARRAAAARRRPCAPRSTRASRRRP